MPREATVSLVFPAPVLSVSLAGLSPEPGRPWSAGPRAAIEWAAACGFRSVQPDATAPGLRPRELDRSARRDVAALLRRLAATCSGLDLLIPAADFADPARAERALAANLGAIELAADLVALGAGGSEAGRVCVSLDPRTAPDSLQSIRDRASTCGVAVADLARPPREPRDAADPIGIGIDPAQLLLAGEDPATAASRAGAALVAGRLSDADTAARVAVGARGGRLDRLAYLVALATAGYRGPMILDLRGLAEQDRVALETLASWSGPGI